MVALLNRLRYYHRAGHVGFIVLFWALLAVLFAVSLVELVHLIGHGAQLPPVPLCDSLAAELWNRRATLLPAGLVLALVCAALGGISMQSMGYRYVALIGSRTCGPLLRWITTDWRPVPALFVLSLIATPFLPAQLFTGFRPEMTKSGSAAAAAPQPNSRAAAAPARVSPGTKVPAGTKPGGEPVNRFAAVLAVDVLLLLFYLMLDMRGRIIIEPFSDHTGEKPDPRGPAISTLLSDYLIRTRDLYRTVDDRTAVLARGVDIPVRDANVRTENVTDMIKEAVSTDTKVRLGFIEFSLQPLMRIFGFLARGRTITGTLYRDGDLTVLTAQLSGGRRAFSWRIESSTSVSPLLNADSIESGRALEHMIAELGCRIFTDLALISAVRWKATYHFNAGLREYRDCLRTQKDRRIKLKRAEKAFMRTLADDEKFEWAYYNLGLVYVGLGMADAASAAFVKAIAQNRDSWEAYYALAQVYFESNEQKNHAYVVALSERVVHLRPRTAKGYRMLCQAFYYEAVRRIQAGAECRDLPESARHYGEIACANAWLSLCIENWRGRTNNPDESRLPERQGLARDCLCSLAQVYMLLGAQADSPGRRGRLYGRASGLYAQATYLCDSDADAHVGLGRVCERLGRYDEAAHYYRVALRVDSGRADIWARVWLMSRILDDQKQKHQMKVQRGPLHCYQNKGLGLLKNYEMHKIAWREFFDRSCDANPRGLADICDDFAPGGPPGSAGEGYSDAIRALLRDELESVQIVRRRNAVYAAIRMHLRSEQEAQETLASLLSSYGDCGDVWVYAQVGIALLRLERTRQAAGPVADRWRTLLAGLGGTLIRGGNHYGEPWPAGLADLLREEARRLESEQERSVTVPGAARLRDNELWCELAWKRAQILLMLGRLLTEAGGMAGVDCAATEVRECFELAIDLLEKSGLETQIQRQGLHASLAEALIAMKRLPEADRSLSLQALEHAEAAVELDPLSAFERSVLGRIYTDFSELQEAESASEDAQLCSPDAPDYLLDEGYAYLKLATECRDHSARVRMLERAVPFLTEAITLYTSTQVREKGKAHFGLGLVNRELNNHASAVGHFRVAETLDYGRLTCIYCKALALLRSAQFDSALQAFDSAIQVAQTLYPGLEQLCSRLAEPPRAGHVTHARRRAWRRRAHVNGHDAGAGPEPVRLCSPVDEGIEKDKERSLGLVLCRALVGKASCYLERDAIPPDYGVLVRTAQAIVNAMEREPAPPGFRDLNICRQIVADCQGWRMMKEREAPYIDSAIRFFQSAISAHAEPESYYHLALAYESKLMSLTGDQSGEERRRLLFAARAQCEHVASLDLRHEFAERAAALLTRLSSYDGKPTADPKPESKAAANGSDGAGAPKPASPLPVAGPS